MPSENKKQTLSSLFFPIFFEVFLVTLVNVIDTAMVSSVSDNAVGAVGASGVYLGLVNQAMSVVSVGAAAIMSRYVGAGREPVAVRTLWVSFFFNFVVGGVFSLIFAFFTEPILRLVGTAPEIYDDSVQYLRYVGLSSLFVAVNFVFTAYLRAFGKPKLSLVSAMIGNVFNIGLNALFISLGYGALGVALATLISRFVTLLLSAWFVIRIPVHSDNISAPVRSRFLLLSILSIGLPAAGESFMWTAWNSVNMTFINGMGATAVNTYSYIMQIANLLSCLVHGYAQSSGILVGWNIGAGNRNVAYRTPHRAMVHGEIVAMSANALLIPCVPWILSLMTQDASILALSTPIMAIHLVRLFGQMGTNIYGLSLKTAGDAKATLLMGVFVMPIWVFIGSYLLGVVFNLGLIGYWIGASMDEFTRCILMFCRWKSRKWEKHCKV